eukprot:5880462-Alexandrium_andersonii.AAC.1
MDPRGGSNPLGPARAHARRTAACSGHRRPCLHAPPAAPSTVAQTPPGRSSARARGRPRPAQTLAGGEGG